MLVDAGHRRWILAALTILVAASLGYAAYVRASLTGPRGGSVPGLIYGGAGFALIVYASVLGARRKARARRIGRASTWMKGHLWLGLLSYPLIWLHAGFQLGGALTIVLMVLFTITILSGVYGIVLQQFVPRAMTTRVPLETTFEEIDSAVARLHQDAVRAVSAAVNLARVPPAEAAALHETYTTTIRPYLVDGGRRDRRLGSVPSASALFDHMRLTLPPALHDTVDTLAAICEERRQLALQRRLHHWLHGWLLLHVPMSVALLVLAVVHAVVSVWY